ncbi:hypothetical protein BN871_CX_00010 [Paenibacillus sp. P22]|nr:hypothetical protein BN871_CX_00010 [Paenibacillus sp. P22]
MFSCLNRTIGSWMRAGRGPHCPSTWPPVSATMTIGTERPPMVRNWSIVSRCSSIISTSTGTPLFSRARSTAGMLRTTSPHQSAIRISTRRSSRLFSDSKNSRSSSLSHSKRSYQESKASLFFVMPSRNCCGVIPFDSLSAICLAIGYPLLVALPPAAAFGPFPSIVPNVRTAPQSDRAAAGAQVFEQHVHDQHRDGDQNGRHRVRSRLVLDLFPVAAQAAADVDEQDRPRKRSDRRQQRERGQRHAGHSRRNGDDLAHHRNEAGGEHHARTVALEPAFGDIDMLRLDLDVFPVFVQERTPSVQADRVQDPLLQDRADRPAKNRSPEGHASRGYHVAGITEYDLARNHFHGQPQNDAEIPELLYDAEQISDEFMKQVHAFHSNLIMRRCFRRRCLSR